MGRIISVEKYFLTAKLLFPILIVLLLIVTFIVSLVFALTTCFRPKEIVESEDDKVLLAMYMEKNMIPELNEQTRNTKRNYSQNSPHNQWYTYPSLKDHRKYLFSVLQRNKLRVLLISDPGTKFSAAAMSVGVGHYDDPATHEGLAHLCEHTLGVGSQKYPDVNTFERFVSAFGGRRNALTTPEETLYHFEISSQFILEALDIFAQHFITPLFLEEILKKEVTIVHQEYQKHYHSQPYKLGRLFDYISDVEHPNHQFGLGDNVTLNKDDLRFQLIEFFRTKYSSKNVSYLNYNSLRGYDQISGFLSKTYIIKEILFCYSHFKFQSIPITN